MLSRACSLSRASLTSAVSRPTPTLFKNSIRTRLASSATNPDIYDVVIVGGGPAGLGLATALKSSASTQTLKIGLVDSQDLAQSSRAFRRIPSTEYSNRCSSLTPASASFLSHIGAWHHLDQSRVQPYTRMNVWDCLSNARLTFDWADTSDPLSSLSSLFSSSKAPPQQELGSRDAQDRNIIAYMAENANLTAALLSRLEALGPVSLFPKTRVESIELGEDTTDLDLRSWPILNLSSGDTLAARLLVGADGPNSSVRTFAGINSHGWDYERQGVVATLRLDDKEPPLSRQQTAYQRFLPTGPIALLPLPGPYASLVWTTTSSRASHLKTLSTEDFLSTVNAAFRLSSTDISYFHTIAGGQTEELAWRTQHTAIDTALVPPQISDLQPNTVASFPLRMRHAAAYAGERVALAGDAAHTIHPLAGQGLNLGLADVAALQRCIGAAAETGADIGSTISLEGYARERYAKNHVMLGVCDKLHKVYGVENPIGVSIRGFGMGMVEGWKGLKGAIMGSAGAGKM